MGKSELYERYAYVGWIFLLSFGVIFITGECKINIIKNILYNTGSSNGAIISAIIAGVFAIFGSPVIGLLISNIVLSFRYLVFKVILSRDVYNHGDSRMFQRAIINHFQRNTEIRQRLEITDPENVFDFFWAGCSHLGSDNQKMLWEWGRRRTTTQFRGYNFVLAIGLGIILGLLASNDIHICSTARVVSFSVLLFLICVNIFLSIMARREVSQVQDLWTESFFDDKFKALCKGNEQKHWRTWRFRNE